MTMSAYLTLRWSTRKRVNAFKVLLAGMGVTMAGLGLPQLAPVLEAGPENSPPTFVQIAEALDCLRHRLSRIRSTDLLGKQYLACIFFELSELERKVDCVLNSRYQLWCEGALKEIR